VIGRVAVVVITDPSCADLIERVSAIARAVPRGSVLVQVRAKDRDGGFVYPLARAVIAVARGHGAPVWVNDRVDVALAAGADGVHLPERGLSIEDARALAPGLAIGCSRHSIEAVRDVRGADLVMLGPIWDTPSKPHAIGTSALAVRVDARLCAIGGIDSPERAREAVRAGADAIAVMRAAWRSRDPGAAISALVDAVSCS